MTTIKRWMELFFDFYDLPSLPAQVVDLIKTQDASKSKHKRKTYLTDLLSEALASFKSRSEERRVGKEC